MYVETSKNEDTWYRALGHYDAEDSVTNADNFKIVKICHCLVSSEASRGSDMEGALYIS